MSKKKEYPWTDKAAGKISSILLKGQTKVSAMINRKINKISMKRLKVLLVVFCFISGGFSLYLVISAVFSKPHPSIKIDKMDIPKHFDKTGDAITGSGIEEELYKEIQGYKRYMDSLGQPIRPGLLDSIRILEQIYHQQK